MMLEGIRHLVFLEPEDDLRDIAGLIREYLQGVGAIPAQGSDSVGNERKEE
jgi:hypothetical protein